MATPAAELQRSHGTVELSFRTHGPRTVLERVYQQGCSRVRFPGRASEDYREAVLMNTAGGLADGDTLEQSVACAGAARALVTTQAAERVYRAIAGPARVRTRIELDDGATAAWLPQEMILFDGARIERDLDISLRGSATILAVDSLVLGRRAMGETLRRGRARDRWRLRVDGRLAFADTLLFDERRAALDRQAGRPAVLAGATAFATLLYAGPTADAEPLRAALAASEVVSGVSAPGAVVIARIVAQASAPLRDAIARCFAATGLGFDLPRVWYC